MQLGIQETCLPGFGTETRVAFAKQVGVDGIEYAAQGVHERVGDIVTAINTAGLAVSGLHIGGTHLLHPEMSAREGAIKALQRAMMDVLDLGAVGVTLFTHLSETPRLPDLHPYKSDIELTAEMLVTQLRATLSDFAFATGASLYLAPQTQAETFLLHRLDMVATILRHNGNHPHVKIAADTACLWQEESDPLGALATYAEKLGIVYLRDQDGKLPSGDGLAFEPIIKTLHDSGYAGWLILGGEGDEAAIQRATNLVRKWL